jgi:hypothetical protein
MSSSSHQFLRRIEFREVRTFYSICEMLECGHRFESEVLLADPLIAKHRICQQCARAVALPPKKPVTKVVPIVSAARTAD